MSDTLTAQPKGIANSLSSSDVVEIKRFAEGKTRIIDLTEKLSSKPSIDPFESFVRVDQQDAIPTVEAISSAWRDLEVKLSQVMAWQDERDDIESEARRFEVGDMERLRKVAKAATEREMSPQDTDLIEITIQTLVAFDTLLRLLKSRQEALDFFQGRLRWEERRKDCWTTYVSLSNDLDDFIRQARWSPQIYQRGNTAANESTTEADESVLAGASTSAADWSPSTTRSATGLTTTSNAKRLGLKFKTQSVALQSRCRSFIDQVVPLASKQLDDLIEQRQLPEAFLDEQDRLEDLADGIKEVEVFIIQLSVQWRKSDEIFRQLRSLHIKGKQLAAALTTAQREAPTGQRLTDFQTQRDALKHKLEELCGEQCASAFIADPGSSPQALIDSIQESLPQPTCKAWSDQAKHSDSVLRALEMEMIAAAKHVRAACHSADKYHRGLHAFNKTNDLVSQLQETADALRFVRERARRGWVDKSDFADLASLSSTLHAEGTGDGTAPDLSLAGCLDDDKHDLYVKLFPALISRCSDLEQDAERLMHALERAGDDCIREGLTHLLYRRGADRATQKVKWAQVEAKSAVDEAVISLDLLKKARALKTQMSQLEKDCKSCLESEVAAIVMNAKAAASSPQAGSSPFVSEVQVQASALSSQADEMSEKVHQLAKSLDARHCSILSDVLHKRSAVILESIKICQKNSHYLESMEKQHRQLTTLQEDHARLTQVGMRAKATLDSQQGWQDVPLTLPEKEAIFREIEEYVSATHSNVVLCGQPPENVLTAYIGKQGDLAALTDMDRRARQNVNEWCSLLSSLAEDIETAWQEAQARQLARKKEQDSIAAQNVSTADELSESDAAVPQASDSSNDGPIERRLEEAASEPNVQARQRKQEAESHTLTEQDEAKQEDKKQRSDPLPMPLKYTQAKGRGIEEDVFGSTPIKGTFSMPEIKKDKVPSVDVKAKVKELMMHCSSGIVEEQVQANGKVQFKNGVALPTLKQADEVKREWREVKSVAERVVQEGNLLLESEINQVRMAVQLREAKVRRFSQLASFAVQHAATEEVLSRFLNILDQSEERDMKEEVQEGLVNISESVKQATLFAEPVLTDARVRHQLSQIRHSYQDMAAMAKEATSKEQADQDESRSTVPSRSSSASSFPSLSGSASDANSSLAEQKPAVVSLLMAPRSMIAVQGAIETPLITRRRLHSSSSGTYATAPQSTPRQSIDRRVVSEGVTTATPSRLPIPASRSNMEMSTPKGTMPQSSSNAVGLSKASSQTPLPSPSSSYGHKARSRSDSGSMRWTKLPTRSPSVVSLSRSTPQQRASSSSSSTKPNQYRANPKSKLDVAVGKIVNKLPMPVRITHAANASSNFGNSASASGSRPREQWHDESGRYWVGHPDPKLCFCRILRSRTVMVRIGGGWQELGTYILKHFSHLGDTSTLSVAASPNVSPQLDRAKMDKLPWISSTSLSTPTGKSGGTLAMAEMSPESAYLTPVRERDELSASFRSPRIGSSSASSSPVMLGNQFDRPNRNAEDLQGMFIRRDRKASTSRIPSLSMPRDLIKSDHHTRSTLASRNRNVSMEQRRRVESLSGGRRVDESGGEDNYARVRAESISVATARPVVPPRALIPARNSPALS